MTKDEFFGGGRAVFTASAPGRLDVIGGIADYSGSLVLEMPIAERTTVDLALRQDGVFRAHSANAAILNAATTVSVDLATCRNPQGEIEYGRLRDQLDERTLWAAYVIGCALVLAREKHLQVDGADIFVASEVPPGKGVSASAALEVATMSAMVRAIGAELGDTELPILCQKVENLVVGAPCGLMDQLTCYLGRRDQLLPILCQPDGVRPTVGIPGMVRFVGIDSGVRHSVGGASYADVRIAAFMGYSIIARAEGISPEELVQAREAGESASLPYGGYLANISVSQFEENYRSLLPEILSGREFSQRYGPIIDAVTTVKEDTGYAVLAATRHPIYENNRVHLFGLLLSLLAQEGLEAALQEEVLVQLGELMFQAHASYNACRLGDATTDEIVRLAAAAGPPRGVYGAKITGGGSGGTVCLLCRGEEGLAAAQEIAEHLAAAQGREAVLFTGSSTGARWQG